MCFLFRCFALVAAVGVISPLPAQRLLGVEAAGAKDPYAAEPFVVERMDTVVRYNADGTGTRVETEVARVQNEAGVRGAGVLAFPYASDTESVEVVYLRVRKRAGGVVDTPPREAQDALSTVAQVAPLYSDQHVLRIGVRGLAVGDRLEFQVRTTATVPPPGHRVWGAVRLDRSRVVLERSVELRVPASMALQVASAGKPVPGAVEGADRVFRWIGSQKVPHGKLLGGLLTGAAGATVPAEEAPTEDDRPALAWTSFADWAAVGAWYRALSPADAAGAASVKAKADAVVYGATAPDSKVEALYRFVSSDVRSINVGLGVGRFGPHAASEVLQNQYGDSQDKTALLVAMLHAEGLPGEPVLASVGGLPEEAVPSPAAFGRVITLTHDAAHGDVWLDPMPEVAPYRMLDAALRDRMALVMPSTGDATLRRTPAEAPFPEFTRFEAMATLSATGTLKAHVDLGLRGEEEVAYWQGLRAVGPAQWDRIAEFHTRTSGLPGEPTNTVAEFPENSDAPLHLSYELNREHYGDWDNFRIVPLEPGLTLPFTDRQTTPGTDVLFGGKRTDTAVSRISLPPGFSADLPPAVHVHTGFATLDKTYTLEKAEGNEVLVTNRVLVLLASRLPATEWTDYRAFLDQVAKSVPYVQLISTVAHTGPGHFPPARGENSAAAAALVQQADRAVAAEDAHAAATRLDEAKATNPRQAMLWSEYGALALRAGRTDEAIEDLRHELRDHPAEGFVSRRLALTLVQGGRTADAVAVLRAAMAANPEDEESARYLAALLVKTDLPGAEKTLRAALAALPDSLALKLALGDVLLKEQKRAEAGQLLTEVATSSQDAAQLNDAAFDLASAGMDLPVAEAASRQAVHLMNASTARGALGIGSEEALRRTAQLVASWDTYGWVLFTEGNTSECEPWLRAAWLDGYGAEAGAHLARLLEKQGHAAEASHVRQLVAEADHDRGAEDQAPRLPSAAGAVASRRPTRTRAGAETRTTLDAEFSFPVSRPVRGGAATSAMFELEYALGTPPVARFVRGDESLTAAAEAIPRVNTHTLLPAGSEAHVVRRAEMRCAAGAAECTLHLLSARAALAP